MSNKTGMRSNAINLKTMPITLAAVVLFAVGAASATAADLPKQWLKDFDSAKAAAAKNNKLILAVFSTAWCGPCKAMVRNVYPKKEVIAALDAYVPVYIDGDKFRKLGAQYGIEAYPTFLLLDAEGHPLHRFVGGSPNAAAFLKTLKQANESLSKLADLRAKIKADPKNAALLRELGGQLAKAQQPELAKDAFVRALDLDPENTAGIPDQLVRKHHKEAYFKAELARLNAAIEKAPKNAGLLKHRGDLLTADFPMLDMERVEAALVDYKAAAALDPDDKTGAGAELAFFTMLQKDFAGPQEFIEATAAFADAHPDSRRLPELQCMRAMALADTGEVAEGVRLLKDYLKHHPDGAMAPMVAQVLPMLEASGSARDAKAGGAHPAP